ncbi:rRNA maturation RNase YbeY [Neisseriaceae bacterium ESL0693]|nr:rRNA maturation RNase YbeY [Neisseriaceae bacterium ESL0693]
MKQAKKNLFLQRLHSNFNFYLEQESMSTDVPAAADFQRWIWQSCKNEYRYANISILLCDEPQARILNRDYRQKDYATNVLSFALNEGECAHRFQHKVLNGDLVLCPEVIAREANEQGKSLQAHYAHLTVHGILHLMGYDHVQDAEAEIMESLEISILYQLGYNNPYVQDEY